MKKITKVFGITIFLLSAFFLFDIDARAEEFNIYSSFRTNIFLEFKSPGAEKPTKTIQISELYDNIRYMYSDDCKNGCTISDLRKEIYVDKEKRTDTAVILYENEITDQNIETKREEKAEEILNVITNESKTIDKNYFNSAKTSWEKMGRWAETWLKEYICHFPNNHDEETKCLEKYMNEDHRANAVLPFCSEENSNCNLEYNFCIYKFEDDNRSLCHSAEYIYYLYYHPETLLGNSYSNNGNIIVTTKADDVIVNNVYGLSDFFNKFKIESKQNTKRACIVEFSEDEKRLLSKDNGYKILINENLTDNDCKILLGPNSKIYTVTTETLGSPVIPKHSATQVNCTGTYNHESKDYEVGFTLSINNKRIRYSNAKGFRGHKTALLFNGTDIKNLLNNDSSILREFENEIYIEEPTLDPIDIVGIITSGVLIVTGVVMSLTGVGIPLGVTTITGGAVLGAGVIVGLVTGIKISAGRWVTHDVQQAFGNADAYLYFFHGINAKVNENAKQKLTCTYSEYIEPTDPLKPNIDVTCETIMDGEFGKILKTIMNILRFIGCGLLVILSAFDFIKPIISSDAEMLQKSGGIFIKRLIVFIMILFIPALVELLLSLINRGSCNVG